MDNIKKLDFEDLKFLLKDVIGVDGNKITNFIINRIYNSNSNKIEDELVVKSSNGEEWFFGEGDYGTLEGSDKITLVINSESARIGGYSEHKFTLYERRKKGISF